STGRRASASRGPTTGRHRSGLHERCPTTSQCPATAGRASEERITMAFRGQVLVNSFSGERFVFHTTAAESGGELLEFDAVVEPHGRVPGGHAHPGQQESFEVRAGAMKFRTGLRRVTAGPADLGVVR